MQNFYYNKNKGGDIKVQWLNYCTPGIYHTDVFQLTAGLVKEIEIHYDSSDPEQSRISKNVFGNKNKLTLLAGDYITRHKNENSDIGKLALEHSSILDWRTSLVLNERINTQKLSEGLDVYINIPQTQRERGYSIFQGLKYFTHAIMEGADSDSFEKALKYFKQAEQVEPNDYFIQNRIAKIYLYSSVHFNLEQAKEYFQKSAREAMIESNTKNPQLNISASRRPDTVIEADIYAQFAGEAFINIARCYYLQQRYEDAVDYAQKARNLFTKFDDADIDYAKYLNVNGKIAESCEVLKELINNNPFYLIRILTDPDLYYTPKVWVMIETLYNDLLNTTTNTLNGWATKLLPDSQVHQIIKNATDEYSQKDMFSLLKAVQLITSNYNFSGKVYSLYINNMSIKRENKQLNFTPEEMANWEIENERELKSVTTIAKKNIGKSKAILFGLYGFAAGVFIGVLKSCNAYERDSLMSGIIISIIICITIGAFVGYLFGNMTEPERI
jgi:tetratricopeptide (TPR) repeat protein